MAHKPGHRTHPVRPRAVARAAGACAARLGPVDLSARSGRRGYGGAPCGGDAGVFRRRRNLDAGRIAAASRWPIVSNPSPGSIRMKRKRCRLPPELLDLAVSALAFQFVNDLPGVLAQIRRALRPDGLLLAAMIGGDTLTELRQAFARGRGRMRRRGVAPRRTLCRSARRRRAVAACGLCTAGH